MESIKASELRCKITMSFNSGLDTIYYKCDKKPIAIVEYNDAFKKGARTRDCLCKTHYNAFIKNTNRITKKSGYDYNVVTHELTINL